MAPKHPNPKRPHVETLRPVGQYTLRQIEQAVAIARWFDRGKFTLVEPPCGSRRRDLGI